MYEKDGLLGTFVGVENALMGVVLLCGDGGVFRGLLAYMS